MAKRKKKTTTEIATQGGGLPASTPLLTDLRQLIEAARQQTARAVNSTLVTMYWHIGQRIRKDVLGNERAEYGKEIVQTLSAQLTAEYGRGFDRRNLFYMIRFAELFPDEQIVNALRSQLSWTHFRELLSIDDQLKRDFYAEMCRVAFVTRQKRITVDSEDYYLDLLFYHRRLRCLVAIDLKLGKFRAADKGQMELYLRWLEKYDVQPGEEPPLGLILCADKSTEHVELLQLEQCGIRVAQYLTELPSKELLEQKLHQSIRLARERLACADQRRITDDIPPQEASDE